MSKKWLFSCVFLCVFMLSTSPVVAQKGSLSLAPSPMSSPGVGEEFELLVNITGGQAVAGYQVTVAFDATALEYVSSKNGDYLPAGAFAIPAQHQGTRVVLAATALNGESRGNGTLAVVTFKVKAVKASTVSLAEALLSNKLGQTASPQVTGAEILADDVDPYGLAEKVYIQHTKTLTRTDVLEVLPDVLYALKAPKVQPLLNDGSIKLIANNPDHLKTFLPDVDNVFIRLLKTDAQIKRLIRDANFQKVLQDPIAIDALVAWMTEDTAGGGDIVDDRPPEESADEELPAIFRTVTFSSFSSTFVTYDWGGRNPELKFEGLEMGKSYRLGSKRKVVFTLVNKQTGEPVPSVDLILSYNKNDDPPSAATVTFKPAVITTDKNGQAETEITFGKQPRAFRIFVKLGPPPPPSWLTVRRFHIHNTTSLGGVELKHKGLEIDKSYRLDSKHKVIFTIVKKRTGEPVPFVNLSFLVSDAASTFGTATFKPAVITTDKNGQAETEITFGKGGDLFIVVTVDEGPQVAFRGYSFSVDYWDWFKGIEFKSDGLEEGKSYRLGSKRKVVFTLVNKQTGEPVPSVDLTLSYSDKPWVPVTFKPAVITTDKNGQAETEITFGKQGQLLILLHVGPPPWVTVRNINSTFRTSYGRSWFELEHEGLELDKSYRLGSKRKVIFTVVNKRTGEPAPSVDLTLSSGKLSTGHTTTATFKPAVITTDKNGQAETEIIFGKGGDLYISVELNEIQGPPVTFFGFFWRISPPGKFEVELKVKGLVSDIYLPGSKHPVIFTVVNKRTGEPVPGVGISLSYTKNSTTTATFKPAVIVTDEKGQAEIEVTLGEKPGRLSIDAHMRVGHREVIVSTLPKTINGDRAFDITFDGRARFTKGGVEFTKTRKKLVVKVKDALPGVELSFNGYNSGLQVGHGKASVTFEPEKVSTDSTGQAETYVTFGEGLSDLAVSIHASRKVIFFHKLSTETNITFDGRSGVETDLPLNYNSSGSYSSPAVSYEILPIKTRKKLVVNVKDTRYRRNIVFGEKKPYHSAKGSVTFEPKEVRADSNGWAVTYITFGEGLRDVRITITSSVNILDKNEHGANVYSYSDGNKAVLIKGLELNVNTSQVQSDFTKYAPPLNGKHFKIYGQGGENTCGQTSARMLLSYYGVDVSLSTFNNAAGISTVIVGSTAEQMMDGLMLLPVESQRFSGTGQGYARDKSLRDKISESRPPIIVTRTGKNVYHHVVVVGYDTKSNKFLIADPGGKGGFYWAPWRKLKSGWSLSDDEGEGYTWGEWWKNIRNANYWGGAPFTPDIKFLLVTTGALKPYRMFVPKEAPPYHHLESKTFRRYTSRSLGDSGKRKWTVPFNDGKIVAFAYAIRHGSFIDVPSFPITDGKFRFEFRLGPMTYPQTRTAVFVTTYYKPGSPAAPVLPLPPGTTVLLPNYPNPFNPETWIPYHLAEPADVTLTIYAIDGKVVRHLDLGHQAAGYYQSKSRAAHWDGRNDVGERVASGIYFYTLTAGEFAATQKMLIVK